MSIQISIIGRVTSEVEVSNTKSGQDVAKFSVVSNVKKRDKEVSTFVNFSVFGDAIERISKGIKKGSVVEVTGSDFEGYIKKSGDGIGYSAIYSSHRYIPYNSPPGNTPQTDGAKPKASGFAGGGSGAKRNTRSAPKVSASPKDEQLNWDSNESVSDDGEEDAPF